MNTIVIDLDNGKIFQNGTEIEAEASELEVSIKRSLGRREVIVNAKYDFSQDIEL